MGKVLGRTALCVPGCNWIPGVGGGGSPSPFIISQLIILFSMLMNHQRLSGRSVIREVSLSGAPQPPASFLPGSHRGLLCHPEQRASHELVIRSHWASQLTCSAGGWAGPRALGVLLQMLLSPSSWCVQQLLQVPAMVLPITAGGLEIGIFIHRCLAV